MQITSVQTQTVSEALFIQGMMEGIVGCKDIQTAISLEHKLTENNISFSAHSNDEGTIFWFEIE